MPLRNSCARTPATTKGTRAATLEVRQQVTQGTDQLGPAGDPGRDRPNTSGSTSSRPRTCRSVTADGGLVVGGEVNASGRSTRGPATCSVGPGARHPRTTPELGLGAATLVPLAEAASWPSPTASWPGPGATRPTRAAGRGRETARRDERGGRVIPRLRPRAEAAHSGRVEDARRRSRAAFHEVGQSGSVDAVVRLGYRVLRSPLLAVGGQAIHVAVDDGHKALRLRTRAATSNLRRCFSALQTTATASADLHCRAGRRGW